jgi:2-desacetyl-2-hydroxyethyl bacteriochlorophyllide A dehydrogenase
MQAVVFLGSGKWAVSERAEPRRESAEDVLIEVESSGICGTDLHILSDPPGHPATPGSILGHEYGGRVVECSSSVGLQAGDRVVVDPNIPCGACAYCRVGRTNHCTSMTTLGIFRDGGLARYSLAPARALHRVGPEFPAERVALAEPLSCIYAAVERVPPRAGDAVIVLGAGPIGLLFVMIYRRMGAGTILVVEPRERRRRVALDLGADAAVDPTGVDMAVEARKVLPDGAEIVVDAAGTLLAQAVGLTRTGGTVLLFGMVQKAGPAISQYDVTRRELTIVGSFIQRTAFPRVNRLLEARDFPVEKIVSHRLPLSRIGDALESMRRGEALKVLLEP